MTRQSRRKTEAARKLLQISVQSWNGWKVTAHRPFRPVYCRSNPG
uniref:Uncharacterized protein n=1 Tax=Siphoviridae sp. ctgEn20 TaxID=2825606 RepID=A0A8S5P4K1_9CAUD|nr:MAG TPA: hypothetical protein [Siphoviridae sp. ctgEn20]